MNIFFLVISGLLGLTIGLLIKNRESKALIMENNKLSVELEAKKTQLQAANEKIEMTSDLQKLIKEDFTLIANKVIKSEQQDLREQNKEALEEKLKPLKENFEQFKNKIEEFNKLEEKNNASLKAQIESLVKESNGIKNTANDLCEAIKNNSQVRGDFGEVILENLLSQAGLINKKYDEEKGNYITQQVFVDISNPTAHPRPDAVVFFPDKRHIIIDSKCPLNNFINFSSTNDENDKKEQLDLFYNSINTMIEDLSEKYNTLDGLNTPEFKLMFIPLESCASYIYANRKILDKASKENIVIVCPSTLLATLKIINKTWKQKIQSENLMEILQSASVAYDKLCKFIKTIEDINTKFISLQKSFESCFKTAQGRNGFIQQIENLRALGLSTKNRVDEKYLSDNIEEKEEAIIQ